MSINSGTGVLGAKNVIQSQNSIDLSPSLQCSRAALMRLKESSQSPMNGEMNEVNPNKEKSPVNITNHNQQYRVKFKRPKNSLQYGEGTDHFS